MSDIEEDAQSQAKKPLALSAALIQRLDQHIQHTLLSNDQWDALVDEVTIFCAQGGQKKEFVQQAIVALDLEWPDNDDLHQAVEFMLCVIAMSHCTPEQLMDDVLQRAGITRFRGKAAMSRFLALATEFKPVINPSSGDVPPEPSMQDLLNIIQQQEQQLHAFRQHSPPAENKDASSGALHTAQVDRAHSLVSALGAGRGHTLVPGVSSAGSSANAMGSAAGTNVGSSANAQGSAAGHTLVSPQGTSLPVFPSLVIDETRGVVIDTEQPHIHSRTPEAFVPNPALQSWTPSSSLHDAERARIKLYQLALGYLYSAIGLGETCKWPQGGVGQSTPWGSLSYFQRAMALIEQQIAFVALRQELGLTPMESRQALQLDKAPFPPALLHSISKEVQMRRKATQKAEKSSHNTATSSSPRVKAGGGRQKIMCYQCHQTGHIAKECPKRNVTGDANAAGHRISQLERAAASSMRQGGGL